MGLLTRVVVSDPVVWVDFRCPNTSCRRYLFTVEAGTVIRRGYCRACGLRYSDQVAR